ncbi:uncharacterized protein LOC121404469 isoform X2 [Drosophila obscura]|uniref:uncharacterized protein LOC121404469 isoform X2 n=1 Tax=Drosophila obscura TaxID=7282 RepID=UPI001BB1CC65|nr:uncharacterized protein LOC121404469 isoform X2 [Drosophila obscura]
MDNLDINNYTLIGLKTWCARLNLPTEGSKASLIAMLNEIPAFERGPGPIVDNQGAIPKHKENNEINYALKGTGEISGDSDNGTVPTASASSVSDKDGYTDLLVEFDAHNETLRKEETPIEAIVQTTKKMSLVFEKDNKEEIGTLIEVGSSSPTPINSNFATLEQTIENLQHENEQLRKKSAVPFNVIKECVPEFNGEGDIDVWLTCIKNVQAIFKVEDDIMRSLICARIKGKASAWFFANYSPLSAGIDQILHQLRVMFGNKDNILETRRKFEQRKWIFDEKFVVYYHEKLLLAKDLNMNDAETIQYLIDGIPDQQLRNQALLQCFVSTEAMLMAFQHLNRPRPPPTKMRPSLADVKNYTGPKSDVSQPGTTTTSSQAMKCYNCHSLGHSAAECRKPVRPDGACYACGEYGHVARDCKLYKKNIKETKNDYSAF